MDNYIRVTHIANGLDNLIPVGTLHISGLPSSDFAFLGVQAQPGGWNWLDADFLHHHFAASFHPVIASLVSLLRLRFAVATYRPVFVSLSPAHGLILIFRVRLFMVPADIDGARFLRLWQRQWLEKYLALTFKRSWFSLVNVLDYSEETWRDLRRHVSLAEIGSLLLIPFASEGKLSGPDPFHIGRWKDGSAFSPSLAKKPSLLEEIVQRIYNSIPPPDVSGYQIRPMPKTAQVPTSEEVVVSLAKKRTKALPGVRTTLYPYQINSLCKMYEKETTSQREPVPNFLSFRSPLNLTYYFDTLNPAFYLNPELYVKPRGGILAENMGLGKTLICLSLVCLTKYDVSIIPEDMILHDDQAPSSNKIPSLCDVSIDTINRNSLPWKFYEEDIPSSVVEKLKHNPGSFKISINHGKSQWSERTKSKKIQPTSKSLYLCGTTLLIVPENLFHQWNSELKKHIDDNYLHKLFVSDRFKKPIVLPNSIYTDCLPQDPKELIQYDLVVITSAAFAKQDLDRTALAHVYWKRLIIDEGHSMGSKSSNISVLCSALQTERRWVVTGTPTPGLTNLHMDEDESGHNTHTKKTRKYVVKKAFNVKEDLVKLGNLVGNYFKIEPFCSQPRLWSSAIVKNLALSGFSSEMSLRTLLSSLMVRHSLANVESDLSLPQLHHEAVLLAPSNQNKLAINLFNAVLAVNAVSSEREGSDYMFDPANRLQLRRLVTNLQLATFYWTGFKQLDVESLINVSKHCMEKQKSGGSQAFSQLDFLLLEKSILAAEEALHNPQWRTASMLHEMQYYVRGLPAAFSKAFSTGVSHHLAVFGAPQITALQEFFYKNRFMDMGNQVLLEEKLDAAAKPFWKSYWTDATQRESTKFKKQELAHDFDVHFLTDETTQEANTTYKLSPSKKTKVSPKRNLTEEKMKSSIRVGAESSFPGQDIKKAQILGTASAKLSYLSSRLVEHQLEGVKSIVFFEFEDSAYYLAELLDILGVNYILYATFVGAGQRANNLSDFDDHDVEKNGGITLIMDLRLAAHGLTIISATRVYFTSPVWLRSVEAQAIKRAHRIGQKNEVFVETLVLKGTLEEEIYKRRQTDNAADLSVVDDLKMQQFFQKHEFLDFISDCEYSVFSSPSVGKLPPTEELDASCSLLRHRPAQLLRPDGAREWVMRLFNADNLEKFNSSKRQKVEAEQLNKELVEGKAFSDVKRRKVVSKKVTF